MMQSTDLKKHRLVNLRCRNDQLEPEILVK